MHEMIFDAPPDLDLGIAASPAEWSLSWYDTGGGYSVSYRSAVSCWIRTAWFNSIFDAKAFLELQGVDTSDI